MIGNANEFNSQLKVERTIVALKVPEGAKRAVRLAAEAPPRTLIEVLVTTLVSARESTTRRRIAHAVVGQRASSDYHEQHRQ